MSKLAPHIGARVGLGTFPFSNGFSEIDQSSASRIVENFVARGGRFLETAPVYEVNQVHLGDILKGFRREQLFVATKCVTGFRDGARTRSGDADWIRGQVDGEMKRLGVDRLDLLQAHILPQDTSVEKLVETLAQIRDGGEVTYIGLSNVNRDELQRALGVSQIDFVQNRYSYLHRRGHDGLGALAKERGIVLNPFQTIERGQLTSSTKAPALRSANDVRNSKHEYSGEAFATVRSWVEELLLPIASAHEVRLETLIVAWTLAQGDNMVPMVGFTAAEQVQPVLEAVTMQISSEALSALDKAYAEMNQRARDQFGLTLDEYRGII